MKPHTVVGPMLNLTMFHLIENNGIDVKVPSTVDPYPAVWISACANSGQNCRLVQDRSDSKDTDRQLQKNSAADDLERWQSSKNDMMQRRAVELMLRKRGQLFQNQGTLLTTQTSLCQRNIILHFVTQAIVTKMLRLSGTGVCNSLFHDAAHCIESHRTKFSSHLL